jgi:hypothetical protein
MQLDACISYPINEIDPHLNASRHEPQRLPALRAALRLFGASIDSDSFCSPGSDASLGAMLAARRSAQLGGPALAAVMSDEAPERASVCLVKASMRLISVEQADELEEGERAKAIAVRGAPQMAVDAGEQFRAPPQVVVTVPASAAGGQKNASLCVERESETAARLSIVSSSGMRKIITSGTMPKPALDRLFAAPAAGAERAASGGPARATHCPDYLRSALASFLERRLRLQCLCTAAEPDPVSRPVVLDHVYLREAKKEQRSLASIRATLHPSSSKCLCAAHGLRCSWASTVEVTVECCGRPLEQSVDGGLCCPCHSEAIDAEGNARFSVKGHCTERVAVSVACMHRNGAQFRKGLSLEAFGLSDADRRELATMLISMLEFEGRTRPHFADKSERGAKQVRSHVKYLGREFAEQMHAIDRLQASTEDPETRNPREMLKRDVLAVDLLRGGGVFRRNVKRGERKGCPYLVREQHGEPNPLKPHETELVATHGSLFRKAI